MNMFQILQSDKPPSIFINMPILNEAEVISGLLKSIDTELRGFPYVLCIVDDGSMDGTIEKIEEFHSLNGSIHLIRREKQGRGCQRGGALRLALEWGLENTDCDYFIEMDGDLSHRPEELLSGISMLNTFDVIIASKYLLGGKTISRELLRRFVSRICTWLLQALMWLPLSDYSNGFRFYTRKAAQVLASHRTKYTTPSYLTEALAIWSKNGMEIGEFSSRYIGRPYGKSKVILSDHILATVRVFEIAWRFHFGRLTRINNAIKR